MPHDDNGEFRNGQDQQQEEHEKNFGGRFYRDQYKLHGASDGRLMF
jgi:hypothetical protein